MKNMDKSYYVLDNGKSAIDYITEFHLQFTYGNCFKYLCRCGKKDGNSAESDLNKALNYITSAHNEISTLERLTRKLINTLRFNTKTQFAEHHLASILKSIITYDSPKIITKRIIAYAKWRNIKVDDKYLNYK